MYKEWLRKEIITECAISDKKPNGVPLCFLILDSSINSDIILEDVNNLLNSGEVPNIFPRDDKEKLIKDVIALYA